MSTNLAFAEKGVLFAYSQGAMQTLIGLTQDETSFDTYFSRTVLLAPCTVGGPLPAADATPDQTTFGFISEALNYATPQSIPSSDW